MWTDVCKIKKVVIFVTFWLLLCYDSVFIDVPLYTFVRAGAEHLQLVVSK